MLVQSVAIAGLLLQHAPLVSSNVAAAFEEARRIADVRDQSAGLGGAKMTIMTGESNVQSSNFNFRTSQIENTGDKRIAAVYMDLSTAMFPDLVIDNDGTGGDDVAKELSHDWGTTETLPIAIDQYQWAWQPARSSSSYNPDAAFNPGALSDVDNLFVSELSDSGLGCAGGFRGQMMVFESFTTGDVYEFSGDMDPNSLAGLSQGTASIHAEWDVGGVSGAEIVGSVVTVLFGDGTTASGTIASDGSQAGAVAIISDNLDAAPGLNVGGYTSGSNGSIDAPPSIIVSAKSGDIVRVTMYSAFDPVDNQEPLAGGQIGAEALVTARLQAQYPYFPVNNARFLQHIEVDIPNSGIADISDSFQFFEDPAVGFTAVVLNNNGEPTSTTSDPIHLLYTGVATAPQCPDGRKLDPSGYCVENSCNANFQCPDNSVRKDNRNCYDRFNDCDCDAGHSQSGDQCVSDNAGSDSSCGSGRKRDPSGYCVQDSCNANFLCPSNSARRDDRNCYDRFNDCECDAGYSTSGSQCVAHNADLDSSCGSGRKQDPSGYCVRDSCNEDYTCPANSQRKDDRNCYDSIHDCQCDRGFTLRGRLCI